MIRELAAGKTTGPGMACSRARRVEEDEHAERAVGERVRPVGPGDERVVAEIAHRGAPRGRDLEEPPSNQPQSMPRADDPGQLDQAIA